MKSKNLIIIFTLFDDKVKGYLSDFNIHAHENTHWLGIGYQVNSLEQDEEDLAIPFPIVLIRDDNYSYDYYAHEIGQQINFHEHFVLVLHTSSYYKNAQKEAIVKGNLQKLVHPIKEEHHDSGTAFHLMKALSKSQSEDQFYAKIETYINTFHFDETKEAKLYLLNMVNTPGDARSILNGELQGYLFIAELERMLQNQKLLEKISGFAKEQISSVEFKIDLIEILKTQPN